MADKGRKLLVIMFADIAGYTALMQQSETKAKNILDVFQETMNEHVHGFGGKIVNSYGDGCLVKFTSIDKALSAAVRIQNIFQTESEPIPVRIGVHLGEVFSKDGNIYGDSVNIASRIESFGIPGSILFSDAVYDQIKNKNEFPIQDLGAVHFKNDHKKRRLYALKSAGLLIPKKSELKGKGRLGKSKGSISAYILAILIILSGLWFFGQDNELTAGSLEDMSIAVIPLLNLNSNEEGLDYFSNGLSQEIIDELAKVHSFRMTPFAQSVYYKLGSQPLSSIANELAVNYIVSGSVRLMPDDIVKLSIELIDPLKKEIIWNEVFEDDLDKAPSFQLKIAREIASSLKVKLSPGESEDLRVTNTSNGEAFKFFLQAKSEMDNFDEASFLKARSYLDKAIALDSNYAQAYTLKAWSITLSGDPLINPETYDQYIDQGEAKELIEKSIKLKPGFSDSYLVRSSIKLYIENSISASLKDVEYALKLSSWPRVPTNYCTCTMISTMLASKRYAKALEISKIAEEIDPSNILQNWDIGNIYLAQSDYNKAIEYFIKSVEEMPEEYFKSSLASAYYHNEQYQEILDLYKDEINEGGPRVSLSMAYLSNAYYKLGELDSSEKYKTMLEELEPKGNIQKYIAMIHIARAEFDQAIDRLRRSYNEMECALAVTTSVDPIFRELEEYQEYRDLIAKMQ